MPGPRKIQVGADVLPVYESAVKFGSIAVAQWAIKSYALGQDVSLEQHLRDAAMVVAGLGLFHLIVDRAVVRFVVREGEEGYYMAMRNLK